jgi:thiol-disulfide isomerase/thioredoxin
MSLVYKGFGSEESNFLAQYNINEEKFSETAFAKEPADFEKLLVDKSAKERESLQKGNYDPEFKTLILSSLTNNDRYTLQTYKDVLKTKKLQGKPSPIFDFDNNTGGSTKLSDLKGKYIYIDIWATWCAPCRQEIPYLEKLEKKYKEKNITFVSISIDEKKDYKKWKEFISAKNLGGIQLIADKDWNSDFILQYEVRGIPRFILIDPNENIVSSDAPRPSNP